MPSHAANVNGSTQPVSAVLLPRIEVTYSTTWSGSAPNWAEPRPSPVRINSCSAIGSVVVVTAMVVGDRRLGGRRCGLRPVGRGARSTIVDRRGGRRGDVERQARDRWRRRLALPCEGVAGRERHRAEPDGCGRDRATPGVVGAGAHDRHRAGHSACSHVSGRGSHFLEQPARPQTRLAAVLDEPLPAEREREHLVAASA